MARKKTENAAALIPEAQQTTIHHHNSPWQPSIILSILVCVLVLLPVVWWVGIFLLDRAGWRKPEESLANGFILAAIGFPALYLVAWIVDGAIHRIIRDIADYLLEAQELKNQGLKLQALAGSSFVPTAANLTDADIRFVRVVKQIIGTAYISTANREYGPKEPRPWSRDVAKETILQWDGRKVGWTDANRLMKYIADNEIVLDGQLNRGKYPTMDAIKTLIDRDFTRPIVKGSPLP